MSLFSRKSDSSDQLRAANEVAANAAISQLQMACQKHNIPTHALGEILHLAGKLAFFSAPKMRYQFDKSADVIVVDMGEDLRVLEIIARD